MSTLQLRKGFTLIELLVVIAIIGILSGVVLTSLSTARNRANDAKVQSEVASSRAQAEIFYGVGQTYASLCTTDTGMTALGATATNCSSSATAWAFFRPLVSDTTDAWCADSTGVSKRLTTVPGAVVTVCP